MTDLKELIKEIKESELKAVVNINISLDMKEEEADDEIKEEENKED